MFRGGRMAIANAFFRALFFLFLSFYILNEMKNIFLYSLVLVGPWLASWLISRLPKLKTLVAQRFRDFEGWLLRWLINRPTKTYKNYLM